jgi:catechol 2,3-dioxygenase-like lactoylglutathione lyase family enzyme
VEGIHHVSLNVRDVEAAESFYVEVLGMQKIDRPDFGFPGCWLEAADGRQIHLIEDSDFRPPEGPHVAFRVGDIETAIADLRARGTEVSGPIDIPGAGRQAFLRDPTGNLVELNQPN